MRFDPRGWVLSNWRLKLLSLVLAVGLLGAVAFSENPPALETVSVGVSYVNLPPNLVLMEPPKKVDVRVLGLEDAVDRYRASAAGVTIDLSAARPGPDQEYVARPKVDVSGVSPQDSGIAIRLTIDELRPAELDIEVRTPKKAQGIEVLPDKTYVTCGNANERCRVTVTAAARLVADLRAYVNYDVPISSANTQTIPNLVILFEQRGRQLDLSKQDTLPQPRWTPNVVNVQVATHGGNQTRTVAVTVRPIGTQACGYALTAVDIQPSFVTVSGPSDPVSRIGGSIVLEPVNIRGITTSQSYQRSVLAGSDQVAVSPTSVTVTVGVSQAFSCAAPSAPTTPAAVPSPTPRPSTGP